jgi:hypothetical protein
MTDPYRKRLNDAYNEFQRKMRGLSDRTLHLRLTALANKGPDEVDPFIRALARRELEHIAAKASVAGAQAELKQLRRIPDDTHFPGQPDKRAKMALRKDELEQDIAGQTARLLSIASDPMLSAREEAIAAYRREEAATARRKEIMGRVAAKKAAAAEAELDDAAERVLTGQAVDKG